MRLLLFGGTGQVGAEFVGLSLPKGVELVAPRRDEVDLQDPAALARFIAAEPWGAVVNAAAYTEVDRAETDEAAAFAVNAEAPSCIARETGRYGIPLIHISTDYVFDGQKGAPYVEGDAVAPLNAYGRTKLTGERLVAAANPHHVILRTSWVYSPYRKNFVKTILRLAGERERLTIVADQRGCPTAARDVAEAALAVALRCASGANDVAYGMYHFAGGGEATWFEFAREIVAMSSARREKSPAVVPIGTADYPTPARRPGDTRLDCTAAARAFGVSARDWREALRATLELL